MIAGASTRARSATWNLVVRTFLAMARMWWKALDEFVADARRANDDLLAQMRDWAHEHEINSDRPGMGRNPKARRHFRQMRVAAENELSERGLLP